MSDQINLPPEVLKELEEIAESTGVYETRTLRTELTNLVRLAMTAARSKDAAEVRELIRLLEMCKMVIPYPSDLFNEVESALKRAREA